MNTGKLLVIAYFLNSNSGDYFSKEIEDKSLDEIINIVLDESKLNIKDLETLLLLKNGDSRPVVWLAFNAEDWEHLLENNNIDNKEKGFPV